MFSLNTSNKFVSNVKTNQSSLACITTLSTSNTAKFTIHRFIYWPTLRTLLWIKIFRWESNFYASEKKWVKKNVHLHSFSRTNLYEIGRVTTTVWKNCYCLVNYLCSSKVMYKLLLILQITWYVKSDHGILRYLFFTYQGMYHRVRRCCFGTLPIGAEYFISPIQGLRTRVFVGDIVSDTLGWNRSQRIGQGSVQTVDKSKTDRWLMSGEVPGGGVIRHVLKTGLHAPAWIRYGWSVVWIGQLKWRT